MIYMVKILRPRVRMSLGSMRFVLILALAAGMSTEVGAQGAFTVSDLADTDTANTLRNAVNLSNNVDAADSGTITVAGTTTLGSSYEALNDALTLSIATGEFRIDQGAFNAFSDAGAGDPGSLLKAGAGTLTVNGVNTYVGGTTLSGGTLQILNGDALGTGALTFNTAATNVLLVGASLTLDENIVLNQAATIHVGTGFTGTLGGTITQDATARALTKTGTGVLVLNGATSHTGITTVSAGTLRLGAAERIANTSNVNLAAGATLDLNNFSESFGSLTGAAGSFVSFNGAGTLTTTTSSNTTYAGTFINSFAGSTVSKAGTGVLTLTGANGGYLGTLNVAGGTVDLQGALGGAVTIGAAGTLRSTGTRAIGGSVTNAGIIAPGGTSLTTAGTFTVAGNYTQTGTYQADLLSTGTSDLLDVTGDATLAGTLALNGDTTQQASYFGRTYTIIEADGTVPSGFTTVTDNFGILNPTVTIDNTAATSLVQVTFNQFGVNLADLAAPGNENQAAAATTVQNILTSGRGSAAFLSAIDPLFSADTEKAHFILDQLVGEINTANATAMIRSNSMFTGLALAQLQTASFNARDVDGSTDEDAGGEQVSAAPSVARFGMASTTSGFGMPGMGGLLSGQPQGEDSVATEDSAVWVMGTGFWGDIDPTAVNQGFEYDGSGFVLGYTFGSTGDWRWGVQGGFAENEIDATETIDTTEVDSWNIGLHGAYFDDGTYANTVLGYVSNEYDAQRFFRFGATDLTGTAKFDGREIFAYGEIGHIYSQMDEEEVAMVSDLSTTRAFTEQHSKGMHKDHARAEHKQVETAEPEVVEEEAEVVEESFAEGWSVAPQLALQYRRFEQDGYATTGAGPLDQVVGGLDADLFQTALGARFFYTGSLGDGGYIVPEVMARWAHEFGDIDRTVTTAFAIAPDQAFVVNGVRPDRDSLQVRAGVAAYTMRDWNVDLSYNGEFGDNFDNHAGVARATWFFE